MYDVNEYLDKLIEECTIAFRDRIIQIRRYFLERSEKTT